MVSFVWVSIDILVKIKRLREVTKELKRLFIDIILLVVIMGRIAWKR